MCGVMEASGSMYFDRRDGFRGHVAYISHRIRCHNKDFEQSQRQPAPLGSER